jgi:hypothetical protein
MPTYFVASELLRNNNLVWEQNLFSFIPQSVSKRRLAVHAVQGPRLMPQLARDCDWLTSADAITSLAVMI